jgi:hypothetical protein
VGRIDISVLLACTYAVFLAVVAALLERLARHSHRRSQRMRTVGFSYHPDLDIWRCPNGKHLFRAEVTRESTAVVYRAAAHDCNSCPIKSRCTDSAEGRTLQIRADSWLDSELRKFHRGLSLMLLFLAALILAITMFTARTAGDEMAAGLLLLCIAGSGFRLGVEFFRPQEDRHSLVLPSQALRPR